MNSIVDTINRWRSFLTERRILVEPLLILFALLLAVLGGLIAARGQPMLTGVFVGAILGIGLLAKLDLALWIVVVGNLIIGGILLQFAPQLSKVVWLFSMLGFLLLFGSLAHWTGKPNRQEALPWFAVMAMLFPLYVSLVSLGNTLSPIEFMAGFKRYFQYWGVFSALILLQHSETSLRRLLRFIFFVALIQVFFAIYQYVVVVPTRVGMGNGVVPIDAVSGTFESSQTGGGASSILAVFVLIVFSYVLSMWRDKLMPPRQAALASLLLLAPLGIGETKIVVVFLPLLVAIVLQRDLKQKPVTTGLLFSVFLSVTVLLGYVYLVISAKGNETLEKVVENIIAYNFGDTGYSEATSLNRTTVMSFWWEQRAPLTPSPFCSGMALARPTQAMDRLFPAN